MDLSDEEVEFEKKRLEKLAEESNKSLQEIAAAALKDAETRQRAGEDLPVEDPVTAAQVQN